MPAPARTLSIRICVPAILCTSIALCLAMLNVRWGVSTGDAASLAWLYVNLAIMLIWFLIWPLFCKNAPLLDIPLILLNTLPLLATSALISNITSTDILPMAALQTIFALFTSGTLRFCNRTAPAILAFIATALPILAYILSEFFQTPTTCLTFAPAIAITRLADKKIDAALYWSAGTYLTLGLALHIAASLKKQIPAQP